MRKIPHTHAHTHTHTLPSGSCWLLAAIGSLWSMLLRDCADVFLAVRGWLVLLAYCWLLSVDSCCLLMAADCSAVVCSLLSVGSDST